MLQEIKSEQQCPMCGKELHITGTFRKMYLVHSCFKCERTFINKNAVKGIVDE